MTASGDADWRIDSFAKGFGRLECTTTPLSLFRPPTADLAGFLAECDVVFVCGGNTKSMLAVWREWGMDVHLRDAYERGTIMAGFSAGSICWFDWAVTDSVPGPLTPIRCLGLLPGSNCPHYNSQPLRRPAFQRFIQEGAIPNGYGADDNVGLHFIDGALDTVVTSHHGARAYRVERAAEQVSESVLVPMLLDYE
jgi:peptidase E